MRIDRPVHPDFLHFLKHKDEELISLYKDLREFLLEIDPEAHELLYHTHALTSVYSISPRLGDAYCMIPIYTSHLNLGFNKGTLLPDPNGLLKGTGKLIRHIPVNTKADFRKPEVVQLVKNALTLAREDAGNTKSSNNLTHSRIKIKG